MNGNRVLLAAHRGDKLRCPENTMPAFQSALDAGVDMIETDVHMTADGQLVLIHDRSAMRTAGIHRFIDEMTLEEVRSLDAGSWFSPKFQGTPVPTVREFMEWIQPTSLLINWELKDYPRDVGTEHAFRAADSLIGLIREYGLERRSMLNSFSNHVLAHCVSRWGHEFPIHGQGIHRCRRGHELPQISEEALFDWCCLYPEVPGHSPVEFPDNFRHCVDHGILPCVCIPDDPDTYQRALALGCKMFTSNDIHTGAQVLHALGVR